MVTPASGDPQSVDITLASRPPAGSWAVTGSTSIQTVGAVALSSPTSLPFTIIDIVNPTIINPGSSNDDCESILRQHLNPAFKGPGWEAVIAGVAAGDCPVFENQKLAFDQLYKTSASGVYLDRITANDGVTRPVNVGMSDETYRSLAIKIATTKVVNQALLEVLAVYYGEDALRAHATTQSYEPYTLEDGDDLNITIDGLYTVKVTFTESEFQLIAAASAVEVAAAITRACIIANVKAFAVSYLDPADGETKVKIYTGSLGLKGRVQIKGSGGGKAQNALKFQTPLLDVVYTGVVS